MKLFNNSAVLTTIATICAVSAAFQSVTPSAGHATLEIPKSRNFYASITREEGDGGGGTWDKAGVDGKADAENCPHCLDQNQGVCGVTQQTKDGPPTRDYDKWLDSKGNPMPWQSQKTYTAGDTIDVKIYMATNHQGHFQVRGCPVEDGKSSSASEECFAKYPLTFVEDVSHSVPKDDNHPERAYIFGGQQYNKVDMEYTFKLPDGLSGEKVLLQYFWYTGYCKYTGYTEYQTEENKEKLQQQFAVALRAPSICCWFSSCSLLYS